MRTESSPKPTNPSSSASTASDARTADAAKSHSSAAEPGTSNIVSATTGATATKPSVTTKLRAPKRASDDFQGVILEIAMDGLSDKTFDAHLHTIRTISKGMDHATRSHNVNDGELERFLRAEVERFPGFLMQIDALIGAINQDFESNTVKGVQDSMHLLDALCGIKRMIRSFDPLPGRLHTVPTLVAEPEKESVAPKGKLGGAKKSARRGRQDTTTNMSRSTATTTTTATTVITTTTAATTTTSSALMTHTITVPDICSHRQEGVPAIFELMRICFDEQQIAGGQFVTLMALAEILLDMKFSTSSMLPLALEVEARLASVIEGIPSFPRDLNALREEILVRNSGTRPANAPRAAVLKLLEVMAAMPEAQTSKKSLQHFRLEFSQALSQLDEALHPSHYAEAAIVAPVKKNAKKLKQEKNKEKTEPKEAKETKEKSERQLKKNAEKSPQRGDAARDKSFLRQVKQLSENLMSSTSRRPKEQTDAELAKLAEQFRYDDEESASSME